MIYVKDLKRELESIDELERVSRYAERLGDKDARVQMIEKRIVEVKEMILYYGGSMSLDEVIERDRERLRQAFNARGGEQI